MSQCVADGRRGLKFYACYCTMDVHETAGVVRGCRSSEANFQHCSTNWIYQADSKRHMTFLTIFEDGRHTLYLETESVQPSLSRQGISERVIGGGGG